MAIRRTRAQTKVPEMAITAISVAESSPSESLSENVQALPFNVVDLPSSSDPPPLEPPSKDHATPEDPELEGPKDLLAVESSSKGQQIQAGDEQTAEGSTKDQHVEKAPEDSLALENLSRGGFGTDDPTTDPSNGETPEEPTENSQVKSKAEHQSEDRTVESLPISKAAVEFLPNSEELPDGSMANSYEEPQKDLPSNPTSSDTDKDAPQATIYETKRQKHKSQKRSRVEPSKGTVTIIDLTGVDSEEEEWLSNDFDDECNDEPISKRVKYERKENRSRVRMPDFPEGSPRASEDDSKRRKGNSHHKFTQRHLSKYMDDESMWFEAISERCEDLDDLHTKQEQRIRSLDALDFKSSGIIVELSADSLQKNKRIQMMKSLEEVEERRRKQYAQLRQLTLSASREGTLIKQDLASWYAKEKKVTERIEKSR